MATSSVTSSAASSTPSARPSRLDSEVVSLMQNTNQLVARRRVHHPTARRRTTWHPYSPRRRNGLHQQEHRTGHRATMDAECIRRTVDEILQQGVGCDHRDFTRRMMDRIRHLQRELHLCNIAVEQALSWWPRPSGEEAWNSGLMEDVVRREITAALMDFMPSRDPVSGHAVLLQPDLPTAADLANQLPGVPSEIEAGLRRRVWQCHMSATASTWRQADLGTHRWRDAPLFMVPAGDMPPQNMPVGCALPEDPLYRRANLGRAARRRHQCRPPRRRLLPPYGELPAHPAERAVTHEGRGQVQGHDQGLRDRSRSRDDPIGLSARPESDDEDAEARYFAAHRGLSYPRRRRTSSPHSSPG